LKNKSILFLGKRDDDHSLRAIEFIKSNFKDVTIVLGEWNDPVPEEMVSWRGDYIISYLSRWVLSSEILNNATISAINFHPASPDYPGIGCNNFALYNEEEKYGVTCHHMHQEVDTGPIINTKSFPIFESDSVASLLTRTYDFQLTLFYEIMNKILNDEKLPISEEKWSRKPFTRKQFNDLVKIEPHMSEEEIKKRVRATSFEGWQRNKKIILIGAGGHAKSCIEIIENLNEYSIYGLLDNSTEKLFRKNLEKHFKDFPLYSSKILSKDNNTVIAIGEHTDDRNLPNVEIFRCGKDEINLQKLITYLGEKGIEKILVEGGETVIWSFLEKELFDELNIFISNIIIGGKETPTIAGGKGYANAENTLKLKLDNIEKLGDGILIKYSKRKN